MAEADSRRNVHGVALFAGKQEAAHGRQQLSEGERLVWNLRWQGRVHGGETGRGNILHRGGAVSLVSTYSSTQQRVATYLLLFAVLLQHRAHEMLFREVNRGEQVVNDMVVEAAGQQQLAPQRQVHVVVIG